MQEGSVIREHRKLGPDVWSYRWWESRPNGNRVHRRIVLGTAELLRDLSSARQMTSGLKREINATDIRMAGTSITVAQLADHFQQRELGCSNGRISYSTKKAYQGYLGKWIVPRWGDYILPNIKAVEVELWLKDLQRAPATCCKIRNVMSVLFSCSTMPVATISMTAIRFGGCVRVPNVAVLPTSSPATRSGNCWRRWNHGSESWSYWMWQQDLDKVNCLRSSGRTSTSRINNSGSLARSCNRSSEGVRPRLRKNPCPSMII